MIILCRSVAVRRGRRRATLVVCPTSLVSHWVEQLQAHLGPGVRLQLLVHHGQSRAVTGAELETRDLVITTYGTLAAEWTRGPELSPLVRAKWLRVNINIHRLVNIFTHLLLNMFTYISTYCSLLLSKIFLHIYI